MSPRVHRGPKTPDYQRHLDEQQDLRDAAHGGVPSVYRAPVRL